MIKNKVTMNYCFQRRYLERIRIGNKSEKQKKTLVNSNKLFNGRNDAIKFAEKLKEKLLTNQQENQQKQQKHTPNTKYLH